MVLALAADGQERTEEAVGTWPIRRAPVMNDLLEPSKANVRSFAVFGGNGRRPSAFIVAQMPQYLSAESAVAGLRPLPRASSDAVSRTFYCALLNGQRGLQARKAPHWGWLGLVIGASGAA